jgi:hypothetical protein
MKTELRVAGAKVHDDGERLAVEIDLANPGDRTLHACKSIRALRYDVTTRVLEVQMSDRGLQELTAADNFIRPRFMTIDPSGAAKLELSVPRIIARLGTGHGLKFAPVERLPAHEAVRVDVEIAWSGTPFYGDPRKRMAGPRTNLVKWAEGFARHRIDRAPGGRPGYEPDKKR